MKQLLHFFAQKITVGPGGNLENVPDSSLTSGEIFANILNIIYFASGAAAVIMIIIGGFMYATAAGSSDSIKKAKNIILSSVIGLVIVALAFTITQFIIGRFSS